MRAYRRPYTDFPSAEPRREGQPLILQDEDSIYKRARYYPLKGLKHSTPYADEHMAFHTAIVTNALALSYVLFRSGISSSVEFARLHPGKALLSFHRTCCFCHSARLLRHFTSGLQAVRLCHRHPCRDPPPSSSSSSAFCRLNAAARQI